MEVSAATAKARRPARNTLTELLRLCRYELFRMRRRPAFIILSSLAVLFIVIPSVAVALLADSFIFSGADSAGPDILALAMEFSISPLFYVIAVCIGALVFGSDFGPGAYRTLHARGTSRILVPLSKVAYIVLALAILLVTGWILSLTVANVVSLVKSESFYSCGDCVSSLGELGRALPGVAFWSLVGACLTFWGRSTALGVGVGLAYFFVSGIIKPLLSFGFQQIWDIDIEPVLHWMPGNLIRAFMDADSINVSYWISGLGAMAYCALLVLVILWLSSARDLPPSR